MRSTRRREMPSSVSAAALFFGATIALRASVLAAFETTYPTDVAKGFARSVSLDPTATERAAGLRVEEKKGVASCGALAQFSTTRQFDHATAVLPQWLPVVVAVPRWNNVTALNPASLLSDSLLRNADTLRPRFTEAQPFPHIAIDGFMKHEVAEKLLLDFPPFESANNINEFGKPGLKAIQPDLRSISPAYAELWAYVCSFEFLEAMSQVTGIRNLLCDPDFFGGGTHENKHGQTLDTHIDYNYARDKRWHRRLNVLLYLNKRWQPEWGGRIELSKDPWVPPQEDPTHKVLDVGFNRAVIFATSEHSWHGFKQVELPPEEQAAGTSRKLISLYLYTRNRPPSETAPPHSTQYVPRAPAPGSGEACHAGLAAYHGWVKPQLEQYFKGEVAQSSINLRLEAAVVQATLGSRVHGEAVKLIGRTEGCGQNLNDPWFETSAWFEVRVRRKFKVHRVDFVIDFGRLPTGNRLAGSMVNVQVLAESGHSIRMAGSAKVLAERSGAKSFNIPLLDDACGVGRCVLTVSFHATTTGNYIGSDVRGLAFMLTSATFVSTASTSRRLNLLQDPAWDA